MATSPVVPQAQPAQVVKQPDGSYAVRIQHTLDGQYTFVEFHNHVFGKALAEAYAASLNLGADAKKLGKEIVSAVESDTSKAESKAKVLVANAESQVKKLLADAETEAEKIKADAEAEAEKIVADAHTEADKIVADAKAEAAKAKPEVDAVVADVVKDVEKAATDVKDEAEKL